MNAMTRIGSALVLLAITAGSAACRDETRPSVVAGGGGVAASPSPSPAPRMRSLRIADSDGAPPVAELEPAAAPTVNGTHPAAAPLQTQTQTPSGAASRQGLTARPSMRVNQRQEGGGNTQVLNADAAGGNVTQRQSGSGNFQSMNIGVVDNAPATPATNRP